jgi:hypothetical protein
MACCTFGFTNVRDASAENAPISSPSGAAASRSSPTRSIRECALVNEGRSGPPTTMAVMRFIHLFLIGYFVLVLGIGLALWQTGVLSHVAPIWIGIGGLVAVGMGIMLSVASGKPTISEELEK